MLHQLGATLSELCHMAGLLVLLYGAVLLIGAVLGNSGPLGFIKGIVLVILGGWFAGLAG